MEAIKIIKIVVLSLFLLFIGLHTFKYLAKGTKILYKLTQFTGKTIEKAGEGVVKSLELVGMGKIDHKKKTKIKFCSGQKGNAKTLFHLSQAYK